MKKKVLIVDDDESAREIVSIYFQNFGFEVLQSKNGEEALLKLGEEEISLVFLDLAMPVMSGEELLEKMLNDKKLRTIPIIIDTSQGTGTGRLGKVEKLYAGKLRFVSFTRPGSMANLQETIRQLLE